MKKVLSLVLTVVMLLSTFSCLTLTVSATSDVVSISFSPAEPIKIGKGVNCIEGFCEVYPDCICDCTFNKYDYTSKIFTCDAVFTVNFTDGGSRDYFYDEDCEQFFSEEGDYIDKEEIVLSDNQEYSHWYEVGEYSCTLTYAGCTTTVPVTIIEAPSASFVLVEPITFVEGKDGYDWDTPYCEYNLDLSDLCQKGNIFRINYSDGTNIDYVYDTSYDDFYDSEGNCLDIWNNWFLYSDQSEENQWTAGEHYFTLYDEYYNASIKIPVTIEENPVKSVSYTPVESIELIENVDGYWTESYIYDTDTDTEECVEWYEYSFPRKTGDILTVNYTDGSSVDYVYDVYAYVDSNGNSISNYDVKRDSDQNYKNQWTGGNSYNFVISYMGRETSVPVTIMENPVESISYTLREPIEFIENVDGEWFTDEEWDEETDDYITVEYFRYSFNYWTVCEKLSSITVEYNDGTSKIYYSSEDEGGFYAEDGECLEYAYSADNENWKTGSDNYFVLSCLGKKVQIPITIVENPIESISYTPAKPVELVGYLNGNWRVTWIESGDESVEWFGYDTDNYDIFKAGDVITVTYKDGTVTEYECWTNDGSTGGSGEYSALFIDKDGNLLPRGNEYDIMHFEDNQSYENQWSVGNEYELTFNYFGKQTTVPVKIVEGPVESINFTPAKPIELVEGVDGYVDDMRDCFIYTFSYEQFGNIITVNYKDGTTKEFVYQKYDFVSDDGEILDYNYFRTNSAQEQNPWTEPGEYSFDLYYIGAKTEVPVTVVENNVVEISVELVEPLRIPIKDSDSFYNISIREDGNKIIFTYKDGSTQEYTWSDECYENYGIGWSDSNNNLLTHDVRIDDNQDENPWTEGGDNYITVECMNNSTQVPVIIYTCEHKWKKGEGLINSPPSCTEVGYEGEYCELCETYREVEIPATGHTPLWVIDKNATCTEAGSRHKECEDCGMQFETEVILATGHVGVKDYEVPATCTTAGKTEGSHCSVCDEVIEAQIVIPATGHTSSSWITDKKATVNAAGSKHRECTECGEVLETATIPQLKPATPKLTKIANTASGVQINWGKVSGADNYIVYRRTYNAKTKAWSGWSKLKAGVTSASYLDKTAKSGTYYIYTVKANNEAGYGGHTSGLKTYFLSTPKLASIINASGKVTVKWNKVSGAKGYIVYRRTYNASTKTWGGWSKLATTKSNAYNDTKAKSGTYYRYTVRAYYGDYTSYFDTTGLQIKFLAMPKLSKVTSAKSGVTVKWGKVAGATGYIVYRKTGNAGWQKIATVKGNAKVSYIDKTAKKGTTYTYTVKAYSGNYKSAHNTTGLKIKDKY